MQNKTLIQVKLWTENSLFGEVRFSYIDLSCTWSIVCRLNNTYCLKRVSITSIYLCLLWGALLTGNLTRGLNS